SEDSNLFRIMKTPMPVVVGGPVVHGPVVPGPVVLGPAVPGPLVRGPVILVGRSAPPGLLSPIYYLANSFLKRCADTHSFCDAIHSEDSNLFRIMKNPVTAKTSFPLLPFVSLPAVPGSLGPL